MSNKTSDKNVANIEDDVKILKEFAEICKRGINLYNPQEEGEALERILAELEQKDKRIQELEQALLKVKDKNTTLFITCRNSIPKQVVIEKINEINKAYEDSKDENGESPYYYPDYTVRVLQEFLGGESK